jgi:hypothetical protein
LWDSAWTIILINIILFLQLITLHTDCIREA